MKLQPVNSELSESKTAKLCKAANDGETINSLKNADSLKCSTAVQLEIEDCASAYCSAPNTETETITEAVRFVLSQFGHFHIAEIREAFRIAAAGTIEANLNAYHGQFSVRILGEVLNAYADYRTQIARQVRAKESKQMQEEKAEAFAAALKERFGTLAENLADLQEENTKYSRWQDLPYWFCRRLIEEDVLAVTVEEKGRVWVEAKHWAVNQVGFWAMDGNNNPGDARRYRIAKEAVRERPDYFPNELEKEAIEAYSKKLVFNHIAPFTGEK